FLTGFERHGFYLCLFPRGFAAGGEAQHQYQDRQAARSECQIRLDCFHLPFPYIETYTSRRRNSTYARIKGTSTHRAKKLQSAQPPTARSVPSVITPVAVAPSLKPDRLIKR